MSKKKQPTASAISRKQTSPTFPAADQFFVWGGFFFSSLFFWYWSLDRYLSPRFLSLSLVLLGVFWFYFKEKLIEKSDMRFTLFDGLMLGYLGLNWASVSWSFSWSEGAFYSQKVFLLFLSYWFFRQIVHRGSAQAKRLMWMPVLVLTILTITILLGQILIAISKTGLDNEGLYEWASGLYGNKGLASDFLFFLLIFNALYLIEKKSFKGHLALMSMLLFLILVLQTRTVYLAIAAATAFSFLALFIKNVDFRPLFTKRIFPVSAVLLALFVGILVWKGTGNSLTQRLDPRTYFKSESAKERRFVWYKTDEMNKKHATWGVGNGSWKLLLPAEGLEGAYRMQEKSVVMTRAHNDYLEVRAEMGLVGAVLFIALFAFVGLAGLWTLFFAKTAANNLQTAENQSNTNENSRAQKYDLTILLAGVLGYCVIQYFDFPRERIEMQMILGILFGWIIGLSQSVMDKMPSFSTKKMFPILAGLAVLGLAFNVIMGWSRLKAETNMVKMLQAHANGNWKDMKTAADEAQNAFVDYTDVCFPINWYKGLFYYHGGKMAESEIEFKKAFDLNPYSIQVMNNYAASLVQLKKYKEATPIFERVVQINPKYDEGKFNLAYTNFYMGDLKTALDWLNKVDTIANPKTENEVKQNRTLLEKQREFRKKIEAGL